MADRVDRPHLTLTARRVAALLGLAVLPVGVLGAFFVLPVSSMIGLGLWPDGRFDVYWRHEFYDIGLTETSNLVPQLGPGQVR